MCLNRILASEGRISEAISQSYLMKQHLNEAHFFSCYVFLHPFRCIQCNIVRDPHDHCHPVVYLKNKDTLGTVEVNPRRYTFKVVINLINGCHPWCLMSVFLSRI